MAVVHLGCLGVFITGVSRAALLVACAAYLVRFVGVTIGFHRLLSHGAFGTGRLMRFLFALAGVGAMQGGPLWWVSHHRDHHRYSDTPRDPHSPRRGFWYAYYGWIVDPANYGPPNSARDLLRVPEICFLERAYGLIVIAQLPFFYVLGTLLGTSGWQMIVWGFFMSTVAFWHGVFLVNSVCHSWGHRPFATGDASTNNGWVSLLIPGEGWHHNHHMFPGSARVGLRWWQVDVAWLLLKMLELLGLVWNIRGPRSTPFNSAQP